MRIGITGARGLVGSCLARMAEAAGIEAVAYSRRPAGGARMFQPGRPVDCSGLDAFVHLAGEPVLGIWTPAKRREIRDSRILGTRSVVEGLAVAAPRPSVLVCASAVGFYGETGDHARDEDSPPGRGFFADLCQDWEAEARRAEESGVRVVSLRIGFVIGPSGAMKMAARIFRLGLGGPLGSGKQWMSGIHVEDVAGMALWAIASNGLRGAVNAVMPEPFRNADFTAELARTLRRPALLPVPGFPLRFVLGDLARILLDDCKVVPRRALEAGYTFRHPTLAAALRAELVSEID